MSEREPLREELAALCHDQWSRWMRYMTDLSSVDDQGRWVIDGERGARWARQMHTPFAELSEPEKEADRAEADRVLTILHERAQR